MNLNEVNGAMQELNDWVLEGDSIVKNLTFQSFMEAVDFVNSVAAIAEKEDHHPDILIMFKDVRLKLTTHSASGLSALDFRVAKEIDAIGKN